MLSCFGRFFTALIWINVTVLASQCANGQHLHKRAPISEPVTADDVLSLKRQLGMVQTQLEEIKQILTGQRVASPTAATRSPQAAPKTDTRLTLPYIPSFGLGSKDAPFVLVEFQDLRCPYCNDFAKQTMPSFKRDYVDTGRVRVLDVQFPLGNHPGSDQLSIAAICAGRVGKYWEMRQALMLPDSSSLPVVAVAIKNAANELGIDDAPFKDCLSSAAVTQELSSQASLATQAGVFSTPTFLLGRVTNGSIVGVSFIGDFPPIEFARQIEESMKQLRGANVEKSAAMGH